MYHDVLHGAKAAVSGTVIRGGGWSIKGSECLWCGESVFFTVFQSCCFILFIKSTLVFTGRGGREHWAGDRCPLPAGCRRPAARPAAALKQKRRSDFLWERIRDQAAGSQNRAREPPQCLEESPLLSVVLGCMFSTEARPYLPCNGGEWGRGCGGHISVAVKWFAPVAFDLWGLKTDCCFSWGRVVPSLPPGRHWPLCRRPVLKPDILNWFLCSWLVHLPPPLVQLLLRL